MQTLDITADLSADGYLSKRARTQIAAHLRTRARDLAADETVLVRVRVSTPIRSTKANALYWTVLGRIAAAYLAAGRRMHAEALHLWFKGLYLPAVSADVERETGEVLDCVRWIEMPDGSSRRTLTTTQLTRDAFGLYLDYIASDDDVLGLGVELGDLLDHAPGLRSGRIDESDDLAGVEYAETAAEAQARLAALFG